MSVNLVAFLLARITEDEQRATRADRERIRSAVYRSPNCYSADLLFIARFDSARMLAECDTKRRIVGLLDSWRHAGGADGLPDITGTGGHGEAWLDALRLLALLYADHDDYRAEWRPQ